MLDPLLAANPNEPILHVQRGFLASASNDMPGARRAFARALELNPRLVEAISGLSAVELASGDFAAARSRVDAAVKALPDNAEVHIIAARTYAASKDLVGAERELKRALELNPDLLPAYTMFGQLYLSQGRLADARREFETLAERHAKPVSALTMLGIIAQMEGDAHGRRWSTSSAWSISIRVHRSPPTTSPGSTQNEAKSSTMRCSSRRRPFR